jgi:hypothetical protein
MNNTKLALGIESLLSAKEVIHFNTSCIHLNTKSHQEFYKFMKISILACRRKRSCSSYELFVYI